VVFSLTPLPYSLANTVAVTPECRSPSHTSERPEATTMNTHDRIQAFLDGSPFAVVGASSDRRKYGNKVLRTYQQNDREAHPVNPKGGEIEGLAAYESLGDLPEIPHGISVITPPGVTETIVRQAAELGIKHVWMQPGAENQRSIELAREADINLIPGDACLLVVLGYRENA
jgi:predicted CoA-binding protein